MTSKELRDLITSKHQPELAKKPGMVWQIWEDGELTLQKSGELLWQRNLHSIKAGIVVLTKDFMPVQEDKHGYAFIANEEVGNELRKAMLEYVGQF